MTVMQNDHSAINLRRRNAAGRGRYVRRNVACAIGMLAFICVTALADPAPWYSWKNVATNERACAQVPPDSGWIQDGGPYKDARCANRFGK